MLILFVGFNVVEQPLLCEIFDSECLQTVFVIPTLAKDIEPVAKKKKHIYIYI